VGIEALSRGAEKVVWVENSRQAQKLIYANLEKCRFWNGEGESKSANWVLLKMDAFQAVSILEERFFQFDIIYVDPPFADNFYEECLTTLSKSKLLKVSSIVVVEHHHKNVLHHPLDADL
jgi:16S rRNA (guanine966-N2)-methyltransferase